MLKTALRFMRYDKPKTIGALLGVVIATFLIGQQSGIFLFLTGAMTSLVDNTQTDLWIVDERTNNVNALGTLDIRFGNEIESVPGVEKVYPLIVAGGSAKFASGKSYGIQLIGSEPPYFRGGPWKISDGKLDDLLLEGAVSADYFDNASLGDSRLGDSFEVGGKRVYRAVQTKGARGFGAVYVFTTLDRARYLGKISRNKASAFLVDLKTGANPEIVRDRINAKIKGIKAWLPKDFSQATLITVLSSTGIAISVGTLIVFAVLCGIVIIGLTLYSAAVDRIKDYAILKAIGANNAYVSKLILLQAFLIALFGFLIGSLLIEGFRNGVANNGVIFQFTPLIRGIFFLITLVISIGGSYFAIRRIINTEPATVFRA